MNAIEARIARDNGGARPATVAQVRRKEGATMATAKKSTTARKATAAKKAAATKRTAKADDTPKRIRNTGTCSVKGCSHDATRRGMCSGKNRDGSKAAGHYRAWLKKQRAS